MYEYMRALHSRFFEELRRKLELEEELEQEISKLHRELVLKLDKPERKTLMSLLDAQDTLRYEVSVASFAEGFRLACGLAAELSGKPYSFDEDETQRLRKQKVDHEREEE